MLQYHGQTFQLSESLVIHTETFRERITVDSTVYTQVLSLSMPSIGNYLLRVSAMVRDLKTRRQVGVETLKYLTIHSKGVYK